VCFYDCKTTFHAKGLQFCLLVFADHYTLRVATTVLLRAKMTLKRISLLCLISSMVQSKPEMCKQFLEEMESQLHQEDPRLIKGILPSVFYLKEFCAF
jgi:hypothetical protein